MDFDTAFTTLLKHEGGYSDHPADPGGKTRFGITEAVAHEVGYRGDMRELRDLLAAWREARRAAWQTIVKVTTTGILAALLVGIAVKLKLTGGGS